MTALMQGLPAEARIPPVDHFLQHWEALKNSPEPNHTTNNPLKLPCVLDIRFIEVAAEKDVGPLI